MVDKLSIGDVIKTNRLKNGWSKTDLANKLNTSVTSISMYEKNERIPTDDKKRLLCNLFNISINELMGASKDELLREEIEKILKSFYLNEDDFNILKEKLLNCFDTEKEELLFEVFVTKGNNCQKVFQALNDINYAIYEFFYPHNDYNLKPTPKKSFCKNLLMEIKKYINKEYEQLILTAIKNISYIDVSHSSTIPILDHNKDIWDYVEISNNKCDYVSIIIEDDSMVSRYQKGDIVIFKKPEQINNGNDVLVVIDEKLYLRKIFFMPNNGIMLQALNPSFDLINLTKLDVEKKKFEILGIPVEIKIHTK